MFQVIRFVNLHLNRLAFWCTPRSLLNLSQKLNGQNLICHISIFVSIHFPFVEISFEISCYILSLYHSGPWQWCLTHGFHWGTFVCKIFCLKYTIQIYYVMLRNVSPFLNTCFIEDIKAIVSYLLTENVYDEGKKHKKIICFQYIKKYLKMKNQHEK